MAVIRIDSVLADIAQREAGPSGIRLVGIDGPSGSGKSTLAARLAARSQAPLIEIDDFVSWRDFSGWWPRFECQVLEPLQAGSAAHYQVRDWANDSLGSSLNGWKTVPWAPLVILEGVTCTRRTAADLLTYRIWVEAPAELRLNRGVARAGESHRQLWIDWMKEENQFFAADGTRARADLQVDGSPIESHDPTVELVTLS
jgi:uridine kinase